MILYGLAGTNGSGKDSLAAFLARKYNFLFVSSSDLLRAEAVKRGLSTERHNLRTISAEWRRESGLGVLVEKAVDYFNEQPEGTYNGLITGSLRNPAEADAIHAHGGKMIWTDADPKIRFARLQSRGREDDPETYEKFLANEAVEMKHSGDAATLSVADVKDRCDIFLYNSSASIDEFESVIAQKLGL